MKYFKKLYNKRHHYYWKISIEIKLFFKQFTHKYWKESLKAKINVKIHRWLHGNCDYCWKNHYKRFI